MQIMNIRNFVIIAHIDHGKSTLADRFLEITKTIEKRKMHEQFLDMHPLEREKGITIKMQPVRMVYHARGLTRTDTQTNADKTQTANLLYEDITYKVRGAAFAVKKSLGLGHKEVVYQKALEIEFKKVGLNFESQKIIDIFYENQKVGVYTPDFIVEEKIIIELKSLPEIGKPQEEQLWSYLKGSKYQLALLINFGSSDVTFKRIVYESQRQSASSQRESAQVEEYILNLIDTPGHVDFSYEVSRALAAVEGAILLVDATQGVQAQTLANLYLAQKENLVIIPAVNKIDLPSADVEKTEEEIVTLLGVEPASILKISGKTGEGVEELLQKIIEKVPPPRVPEKENLRALIFDSVYDPYQGVIAHIRVVEGTVKKGERIRFAATKIEAELLEVGVLSPERSARGVLGPGEIGYVATGIKEPASVRVGDTIAHARDTVAMLPGYREPEPMVFASIFPENQDEYEMLRESLKKLKLNDASLTFEPEDSSALGRGFRAGFLGMLHMEIVSERLLREYSLKLTFSNPSVAFRVKTKSGKEDLVYSASKMPESQFIEAIEEPLALIEIITPPQYLGALTTIVSERRGHIVDTTTLAGERIRVRFEAPLREIIIDFYDKLKSLSQGFASMSYELRGFKKADLVRLDILVAGEKITPLSEMIPRDQAHFIGRERVAKLKELLPRELFSVAIQAEAEGRIIARETLSALKKDVTGYLYGGDRTRKMKLWKKQQRGKKKLKEMGRVAIPSEVFLKMLRK